MMASLENDYMTPRRVGRELTKIIEQKKNWKSGAEIGVAQGRTTYWLLKNCRHITSLIAVDPFYYIEDSEKSGLYKTFDFSHNEA